MKKTIAMVLVGGQGARLEAITKHKAKPAVSFAGKYKLIDFVLSNLSHSKIDTVGIITQYEPHELMHYIQRGSSWDLDVSDGGIHFLTPYSTRAGTKWQKGTAHAIGQHLHFIRQYKPENVLVLAGDHIYKTNYNTMINEHKQTNADITIGTFEPKDDLSRYGIVETNDQGKIIQFEEKPSQPKSTLASMGIYLFETSCLEALIKQDLGHDFGKNIIPKALKNHLHLHAYKFSGYFRDVGTVKSLFDAHMELLDSPNLLHLNDTLQPVYTKASNHAPHRIVKGGSVRNAMVADGTMIAGSVERSVIGPEVVIHPHASVKNAVVYQGVKIGENAVIENCIIMEDTVVLPKTKLVFKQTEVIDNETLWLLGGTPNA